MSSLTEDMGMLHEGLGEPLASRDFKHFKLYRHSGSPISLLPCELLIITFLICSRENTPRHSGEEVRSEITLSHVSRDWRSVALTTPLLWTTIQRTKYQNNIPLLSAYLERSQPVPFDLFAEIGYDEQCQGTQRPASESNNDDPSNDVQQCGSPFCRIVGPHFSRCQDLRITIANHGGDPMVQLCIFTSFPAPILNILHVSMQKQYANPAEQFSIFGNSGGRLSRLSLMGMAAMNVLPPLNMVTHLRLNVPKRLSRNPNKLLVLKRAFAEMHCLDHLELRNISFWVHHGGGLLAIPTVRTMILHSPWRWSDALYFLRVLTVPSLENITILCDAYDLYPSHVPTAHATFPRLQSLRLIGQMEVRPNTLLGLSTFTSSITELYLIDTSLIPDPRRNLQNLDVAHGLRSSMWPCLRVFGTNGAGLADDLRHFITRRATMGYPIRKLLLSQQCIAWIVREFQAFGEEGPQIAELPYLPEPEWWYVLAHFMRSVR